MLPDRTEATEPSQRDSAPFPVKIIVSGGFGVGKTTMIGAVSEIDPLTTEEHLTVVSDGIDSLAGVEDKTTTTVALDFGRLAFPSSGWCCICSAHPVRTGSGSPGTTSPMARWAPWCWPTPVGCPTASARSATSSSAASRS